MKEVKSSPKLLKKTQVFSTSNLHKQKQHLPSRYAHQKLPTKNQMINILSSIQTNVKTSQAQRIKLNTSPSKLKLKQSKQRQKQKLPQIQKRKQQYEFKPKPLKRQQSDFQQYKQIFINPIKQNLDTLQQTKNNLDKGLKSKLNLKGKSQISKEYQKLLEFQNGKNKRIDPNQQFPQMNDKQVKQHYEAAIKLLQNISLPNKTASIAQDFYEQQIRIEPPDFPNSSVASTLSPGSGYAPSIPLTSNISKKNNLHELLIRAKAGMNTQDIQKQAHLSFYLGMVYEEQRDYVSALKFYRRYLGFAKGMEDKIGMALGANRVAINYFYNDDIKKSIVFHNENLKLSDNENCFAGFYNLGICHRKIQQYQQALQYFETALQWASQNGQSQSQCITYGQIAATYKSMQLFQKSLQNFEKSLQLCHKLKKIQLQQKNLMNIILIASQYTLYTQQRIHQLTFQAYQCSKMLNDKRLQQIFSTNLGIINGKLEFKRFTQSQQFQEDIQQIQI